MREQTHGVLPPRKELACRTTCGRDVRVGWLALGAAERPARRVSLDIGHSPGREDGTWAALTPAEARQLAAALLRHAATAEQPDGDIAAGRVEVSYLGGESYAAATRGHAVLTDQPPAGGGEDAGMTPTDLLAASLSSCVAFYVGRYLARHGLNRDGLQVTADFALATDRPARVRRIGLRIRVPGGVPPGREAALLAVASHCTVHNTLRHAPDVAIELG
jgi:putative redox protein